MTRGKKSNPDAENGKKVNIYMSPDDQTLMKRLLPEFWQNGPTGLFRALMLAEAKRRGWSLPESAPAPQKAPGENAA